MVSKTDLANWAFTKLGAEHVDDIETATSEKAETVRTIWNMVRDDELRARVWRFSVTRETLAADVTAPEWGYDTQYTLPGDCVRVVQVSEYWAFGSSPDALATSETARYLIEADKILTDIAGSGGLKIRYVTNDVDIGLWDASFSHAFACRLALELCERLTEASSKRKLMADEYRSAVLMAARANAIEHPPRKRAESRWVLSRYGA